MIRVQFMCLIFHLFPHLLQNHFILKNIHPCNLNLKLFKSRGGGNQNYRQVPCAPPRKFLPPPWKICQSCHWLVLTIIFLNIYFFQYVALYRSFFSSSKGVIVVIITNQKLFMLGIFPVNTPAKTPINTQV